jgi:hypothetical protein
VALESRQDEIDGKVSQLLASTALHTEALAKLKSMLARYIGKEEHPADIDPSLLKSIPDRVVTRTFSDGRTDGRTDGRSDDGRGGVRDLDAL